jgi:hypothetical protein
VSSSVPGRDQHLVRHDRDLQEINKVAAENATVLFCHNAVELGVSYQHRGDHASNLDRGNVERKAMILGEALEGAKQDGAAYRRVSRRGTTDANAHQSPPEFNLPQRLQATINLSIGNSQPKTTD